MVSELCAELHNYFLRDYTRPEQYMHEGSYVIANGEMQDLPFLKDGQYYRIIGSTFNDGVYCYGKESLIDETFDGVIWEMFIPRDFSDLANEIAQWVSDNADAINSPYQSESFGGYSYTKAVAGTGELSTTWQAHFANRLNRWRRTKEI